MQALIRILTRWSWVFGLVGSLGLIGATSTWYVAGSPEGTPTALGIGGVVALALYLFFDRARVGGALSSRNFLYGSGSSLMVAMATGIAVGSYVLARERDKTWDLTRTGDFTLSEHTVRFLEDLDRDVEVLAFLRSESAEQRQFGELARRLQEHTSHLDVVYVDPLREPRLAERHEIVTDSGTIILRLGDEKERRIEVLPDEEAFVKALTLLLSDTEHRVCWSLGHGESDPDDETSEHAHGAAVAELEGLNYAVTRTRVASEGIDRACDLFVVARAELDWLPYELEALAAYVAEGGRVLLLLDPGTTPSLAEEAGRYGIEVGADVVLDVDPKSMLLGVDDPSVIVLTDRSLLPHPITRNLSAAVVLGMARSVTPTGREGIAVQAVLEASAQAWAETSVDEEGLGPSEGEKVGQVPLMVVAEVTDPAVLDVRRPDPATEAPLPAAPSPAVEDGPTVPDANGLVARAVPADLSPVAGGRLVVIGDADFASNVFLSWGNNRDLFLNSLAWLAEEENQIGERPEKGDLLEITGAGEAMLCLISIVFVPGGAAAFAAAILLRRRFL